MWMRGFGTLSAYAHYRASGNVRTQRRTKRCLPKRNTIFWIDFSNIFSVNGWIQTAFKYRIAKLNEQRLSTGFLQLRK